MIYRNRDGVNYKSQQDPISEEAGTPTRRNTGATGGQIEIVAGKMVAEKKVRVDTTVIGCLQRMGMAMFKALVQHIDSAAEKWLPLAQSRSRAIAGWAELHGWVASDPQCQRLLVRQALLNAVIRQAIPSIKPHVFPTPADMLGIEAPASLADEIRAAVHRSQATIFNFWGELYNALIPQSQRRHIGQFWTNEQIAEWMVAWLLQGHPHGLADVGCGAGNFLLKSLQHRTATLKHLYGCDLNA